MSAAAMRPARGFGLIEVLIALAVVGALASVALPSFAQAMHKSRRAEAVAALLQVQLAQERWRSSHPTYATTLAQLGLDERLARHYRLAVVEGSASGHSAVATAIGTQAADAACASLRLTLDGGRTVQSATGSAPAGQCWGSR